MSKTRVEIADSMKQLIRNKYPYLDISEGEILNDIVILAPAVVFEELYSLINLTSESQSILTASDSALEKIAANIGLLRKSARVSTGVVTFYTNSIPANDIIIAAGTKVGTLATSDGAGVQFMTLQSVTLYATQVNTYYNSTYNRYEISSNVVCIQAGVSGVVGIGTINSIISSITGIDGCINYTPTSGGAPIETSQSLLDRIQKKWLGTSLGTYNGILNLILSDPSVIDAEIVKNGDTNRDIFGVVDVYVRGEKLRNRVDVFTSYDTELIDFVFTHQPAVITGISYVNSSVAGVLPPSLYEVQKDLNLYGGSIFGSDTLHWTVSLLTEDYDTIVVSYLYNGLIEDIQNLFSKSENSLINTSVIVKEARKLLIDLEVDVTIKTGLGLDNATLQIEIQNALALFFDSLGIGAEVQQADVALAILSVPGVDDLKIPFVTFQSSDGSIVQDADHNLVVPSHSYGSAGNINVNIVVG